MASNVHHPTSTGRQVCLIGIAILLLAGFCFGQAAVSLSPKDGPPTTSPRVSGSGFTPYAQIDIYFDTQDQALAVADAAGTFRQIAIQAPKSAVPGNHWVTAAERSGRNVKQEIFEVHVNWDQFHTMDMRRENPYENVLNVDNVGSMRLKGSYQTGSDVSSSPAVVNGVMYVGSWDGNVYAMNAKNGTLLWSYHTSGRVLNSPAVANGVVYVGAEPAYTYALNASTGALLWTCYCGGDDFTSPAVVNGVVYVGDDAEWVHALDASTGAVLWGYDTLGPVHSSPAVAKGVVYFGSNDGNVYALDASTGVLRWSYNTGSAVESSPAVVNGVVYVGSDNAKVYALSASTGALLGSYTTGYWPVASSPAVANGVLYVGSYDGNVYALDVSTGALLWSHAIEEGRSSPAVANGVVYVGGWGEVHALDASNGALLGKYSTGGDVESSPTVANGVVYVGSYDGKVYAFGLPKELQTHPPKRPDPKTLRPDFNLKVSQPIATTGRANSPDGFTK